MIPIELKSLIAYDPLTGIFRWKFREPLTKGDKYFNSRFAGNEAGSLDATTGYVVIGIKGKTYKAHRLAWFYMNDFMPERVDHRDDIGHHNWISNLREATVSQNACNMKRRCDNKTGFKGVQHIPERWRAVIYLNRKETSLGLFETPEAAHAAYCEASKKLHGEFGRIK